MGPVYTSVAPTPAGAGEAVRAIAWTGVIDRENVGFLAPHLFGAWASSQPRKLLLDLNRVSFLDSAGLGLLGELLDQCGPAEWLILDVSGNPRLRSSLALVEDHPACRIRD